MRLSSLLWLILLAAICVSWWKDRQSRHQQIDGLRQKIEALEDMSWPTYYPNY